MQVPHSKGGPEHEVLQDPSLADESSTEQDKSRKTPENLGLHQAQSLRAAGQRPSKRRMEFSKVDSPSAPPAGSWAAGKLGCLGTPDQPRKAGGEEQKDKQQAGSLKNSPKTADLSPAM